MEKRGIKKSKIEPPTFPVRYFCYDDMHKKTPRMTIIAFVHDRNTGLTKYGASLYRKNSREKQISKKEIKSQLRETANLRLSEKPVCTFVHAITLKELRQTLRKVLFTKGVSDKEGLSEKACLIYLQNHFMVKEIEYC